MNNYYTYAYLREDRTPYYVGKGKGWRAYKKQNRSCPVPEDKDRIILLKKNLTEEEAFEHERYMIAVLGRKDLGTGILRNLTDGGEGISGAIRSKEMREHLRRVRTGIKMPDSFKEACSERMKNFRHTDESKNKISEANKGRKWSKESIENISKIRKGTEPKCNKEKWMCLITGKITTAGPLTGYQRARGIDISQRVKI